MRPSDFLSPALAFGLTLALTPLVRALARRYGAVARPRLDRWHRHDTAKFGGVAIFVAVAAACWAGPAPTVTDLKLWGAAALLGVVGLGDDLMNFRPYQKLLAQCAVAAVLVALGFHLPWTPWPLVNGLLAFVWVVGVTNALNLLDNMDGLAAGVGALAASFLAAHRWADGELSQAVALTTLAAALLGFLVYNRSPASIFMGDCGSLFVGCALAGAALRGPADAGTPSLRLAAVAVLPLAVPIFDTTLVTVLRPLAGRSVFRGGCDHTSHRLVALGLSEGRAVGLLYILTALSGAASLAVRAAPLVRMGVVVAAVLGAFAALAGAVMRVRPYAPVKASGRPRGPRH